jgi:ADP-ribose pyrophosphatase
MSIVYTGRVFAVERTRMAFPNGKVHDVEVVRHAPSVVLIPLVDPGQVVLIRQFRASIRQELWELPAGSVDGGETPEEAAVRECEEEIGLVPSEVVRLRGLYPTPGFCDEQLIFFKVSGLRPPDPSSTRHADEDEDIRSCPMSIDEARAMAARGEIIDLKTAYGLTLI